MVSASGSASRGQNSNSAPKSPTRRGTVLMAGGLRRVLCRWWVGSRGGAQRAQRAGRTTTHRRGRELLASGSVGSGLLVGFSDAWRRRPRLWHGVGCMAYGVWSVQAKALHYYRYPILSHSIMVRGVGRRLRRLPTQQPPFDRSTDRSIDRFRFSGPHQRMPPRSMHRHLKAKAQSHGIPK